MRLAEIFERFVDGDASLAFRAYDGSRAGPADAPAVLDLRTPRGLRYVATAPGELGLARAYVAGDLVIGGDLHAALVALARPRRGALGPVEATALVRALGRGALRRPPLPPEEAPAHWRRGLRRHTRRRDEAAIAHHYDVSNRFYEWVLGPTMAYSCAVFPNRDAHLDDAQHEKFDLICRKLDLRPGERLLDVGAGWGGLVRHAAAYYGVRALGVTISREQAAWSAVATARAGLRGRAEVRLLDWRDVPGRGFDAISSVGVMEHIGKRQLAAHFARMATWLRPGGRMLNHAIARPTSRERARPGAFIDRYVFPDGELEDVGTVVTAMHDNGLEVRHEENLREHYALTLREWGANLDRHWDEAVAEVGVRRARVWRLYMAMSRVGFELDRIQLHQVLGVRLTADGRSDMPLRPAWELEPPARYTARSPERARGR